MPSSSPWPLATRVRKGRRLARHRRRHLQRLRQAVHHVEVLQHLEGIARGREVASDQPGVEALQYVAAGVPGAERRGDPTRVHAARFGERERLGQDAVVGEHDYLVDHLGDLPGAERPHVSARPELVENRLHRREVRLAAAGHDRERAGLRRGRTA
jgi:hypothetical protein